jgi:UDP-N-acetylglucosamine--N-acetylmuramyl-(pentapeptide) pyrophosphoryl-undecaprenol N-acetylglucosamine transferase
MSPGFGLAAAGTGGHVYPALAVAEALEAAGVDRERIVFFGGDRMEATAVPAAGYPFVAIRLQGLRRSPSPSNLRLPLVVARATRAIRREIESRSLDALIGFGGYVTVPAAVAARRRHIPVFLQEQNAVAGLANRLMASRARAVFTGFPVTGRPLPNAVETGNPLRRTLRDFDRGALRSAARERYDLPADATVLGVLGGSLGAMVLNDATAAFVAADPPRGTAVVHLTGRAHRDRYALLAERSPVPWTVVAYEDEMEYFFAAADLVLSRAGAITISELAATASPAVVVPYAAGTAGHQGANAAHLLAAGAVEVVAQEDAASIPERLSRLLSDGERREAMAAAAASRARPDAADRIAAALLESVR